MGTPTVENPSTFEPSLGTELGEAIEILSSSEPEIAPYNVKVIDNVTLQGPSFQKHFTLAPGNGKELNICVKNNHSSKSVRFIVERTDNNQDFGYVTIEPGTSSTRNFTMKDGEGMEGTWKVYVTSNDGHRMDLFIHAGQF